MFHVIVNQFFADVLLYTQMWGRNGVLCSLLVLCLWASLNAVPVAVDKTKVSPPAEELEPPKSVVRNMFRKSCVCQFDRFGKNSSDSEVVIYKIVQNKLHTPLKCVHILN